MGIRFAVKSVQICTNMNKYCSIAWRVCESYKIVKLLALNTLYYVIKSSK